MSETPMMILSNTLGQSATITLDSVEWHIDTEMFCDGIALEYAE